MSMYMQGERAELNTAKSKVKHITKDTQKHVNVEREGEKVEHKKESIYLYFPPSSQLVYLCFCPVGLSLL